MTQQPKRFELRRHRPGVATSWRIVDLLHPEEAQLVLPPLGSAEKCKRRAEELCDILNAGHASFGDYARAQREAREGQ